jgi:hypothetical protein
MSTMTSVPSPLEATYKTSMSTHVNRSSTASDIGQALHCQLPFNNQLQNVLLYLSKSASQPTNILILKC